MKLDLPSHLGDDGELVGRAAGEPLGQRAYSKLQWRCRRGLLENDLFIEKFFARHGEHLTVAHARGMYALMDLADNDLLDLLLRRKQPVGPLDTQEVREVLALLVP
ncbi:succinate dehydrogenase assembly factor 2 [Curvibacter sp. RS43]|uniref:FAD assembly factor SdhE n=1 Tax=Curvibacter microcysteis TaxID=3026419 RepID=A0ABT5MKP9_9BURK|nr:MULTISPECIES: succinate dehydrogenase assembly factor 2 [unclassified Curvibacter]MDD0809498.1 succinate dehydrogenase assembly factor 2 [Curvibacter sp. RS43]MDD0817166.1 succinate dehydrogenase assembly factor 2 [Curvibacter sp. HBC28]